DDGHAAYEADLHAVGLGFHTAGGLAISLTGGVGIGGPRGAGATHLPVELDLPLPAGPGALPARAGRRRRVRRGPPPPAPPRGARYTGDAAGVADEASGLVGVRLGRDRRYWAKISAGGGPFLALTYRDLGGDERFGVALGVDLWGGD